MNNTNAIQQTSFNFNASLASNTNQQSALFATMNHIADRLHAKLEIMLGGDNLDQDISLVIGDDDKGMIVAAMQDGMPVGIPQEKIDTITQAANMVIESGRKVFMTYDQAEMLFKAVSAH